MARYSAVCHRGADLSLAGWIVALEPAAVAPGPIGLRRAHAEHTAGHQFSIRVQGRTPQKVGVLLFVALAERQVFILPDSGISTVVDPDAWRTIVDRLVLGMRSGPATDAFAATIGEIFAILSMHFPRQDHSAGVLPNEVIEVPRVNGGK